MRGWIWVQKRRHESQWKRDLSGPDADSLLETCKAFDRDCGYNYSQHSSYVISM